MLRRLANFWSQRCSSTRGADTNRMAPMQHSAGPAAVLHNTKLGPGRAQKKQLRRKQYLSDARKLSAMRNNRVKTALDFGALGLSCFGLVERTDCALRCPSSLPSTCKENKCPALFTAAIHWSDKPCSLSSSALLKEWCAAPLAQRLPWATGLPGAAAQPASTSRASAGSSQGAVGGPGGLSWTKSRPSRALRGRQQKIDAWRLFLMQ